MNSYKPYKHVPLRLRCPHGYNKTECVTCVSAAKSAKDYASRKAIKHDTNPVNGVEELLR